MSENIIDKNQRQRLVEAIQKAEKNTSPIGEFGFPLFSFVF